MKEEPISHRTSLVAKEKGFREKVNAFYDNDNGRLFDEQDNLHDFNGNSFKWISAPSQSFLQRWLRERHDIHIVIDRESLDSDEMCYVYVVTYLAESNKNTKHWVNALNHQHSFGGYGGTYYGGWDTYEEALNAALDFSLTMVTNE